MFNLLPDAVTSCTGLVFRGYSKHYVTRKGNYERKEGVRLLERVANARAVVVYLKH